MIAALFLGAGLNQLAWITLSFAAIGAVLRAIAATIICPQLSFSFSLANRKMARELLRFGVKTILIGVPSVIAIQGIALMVGIMLGPAALAVLTRPIAITRHIGTLNRKYTHMLIGVAGGLAGSGRKDEVAQLLISAGRTSFLLVLPMYLTLGVFGEHIVRFWMGPAYIQPQVAAILAASFVLPAVGLSATHTLAGLNHHGKIAAVALLVAVTMTLMSISAFVITGVTLETAAAALGISICVSTGVVPIVMSCRQLGVSLSDYVRGAMLFPAVLGSVLLIVFLGIRGLLGSSYWALFAALIVGTLTFAPVYWKYVLDDYVRSAIGSRVYFLRQMDEEL
jgi:O-antigen/teichoic acid export membrane protein